MMLIDNARSSMISSPCFGNVSDAGRTIRKAGTSLGKEKQHMRISLLVIALCLSIGVALAQTGGSITGEVKDQSGAMAPNAAVTVTNSKTGVVRATATNSAGIYS